MKKKINIRMIMMSIIAIIASVVCITIVYYNLFENQIKNDLKISAQLLRDTRYFESVDIDTNNIYINTDNDQLRVTWIDSDGTVLYDNDRNATELENHMTRPEVSEAFDNGSGQSVRKSDTMNMSTFYYAMKLDNGTVLRVATQAKNIQSVFFATMPIVLIILGVVVIVCILLSHMLTKQLISPIEAMAEHIEDTNQYMPYKELRPFADMIRSQHAQILSSAKMRQDFTANVSHELKTPLTAISGYAELIENHMVEGKDQEHFAKEIRKNATRLLTLINDIIRLSELDHCEKVPQMEEIDLFKLAQDTIEPIKMAAAMKNVTISLSGEACNVRGNKDMLRELIDNIVQNAVRYNNDGGYVKVNICNKNGDRIISVKDNGIGIPKEDQQRIFERFYRVDKSRSKETGGTGLGLAIVKHIVDIHGARLELESKVGEGTCIRVLL